MGYGGGMSSYSSPYSRFGGGGYGMGGMGMGMGGGYGMGGYGVGGMGAPGEVSSSCPVSRALELISRT
jgi:peroxin-13